MKLNENVYGAPTEIKVIDLSIKVVGNGPLQDLINTNKIQLNKEFDQSIIYAVTNNSALTNYAVPYGDSVFRPKIQKFTATRPMGLIMCYGGIPSSRALNFYFTSYPERQGSFLPYLSIGYGVTSYGHNPYGDGSYTLVNPRFVTGYKWQEVRWYIILYVTNILAITNYNAFEDWTFKRVSLQDYKDNVNNVATENPNIVGADITPILHTNGIYEPEFCPTFYTTINTSSNKITNDYAKDVKNDTFYVNQNRKRFLLGAENPWKSTGVLPMYFGIDDKLFEMHSHIFKDGNQTYQTYVPLLKGSLDDLIKTFCYLGIPITTNIQHARDDDFDSEYIYTMGINDSGLTDGNLKNGSDNNTVPQIDYTDDILTNNNFGGIDRVDPNNYTDKIDLNKPTLSNVNVFNRSFAVTPNNVRQLADFLWNADETKFNEIVKGLALMGENPMNGIIDLRLFPFNVALKNSATQAEPIVIGRTNTGVNGIKLTENVNSLIDLGECTFFEKFKNFLDFEPYTTAQLYIPYIGVVPVSTAEFMGHKISAKMLVDYTTGAGTAIVFKDDIPFIYRNGVVGVSIPMTGTDSASYASTVIGNVISGVSQIATAGVGSSANFEMANTNSQIASHSSSASAYRSAVGASGQRAGAVASGAGGIMGGLGNIYNGFTTPVQYQSAGASSPSVATWQPQKCYFIIDRPILNVPDNYGRTVGYACEITGKLSDFNGFTVVSNPEISFKCTEAEKTMLSQLLTAGIFV